MANRWFNQFCYSLVKSKVMLFGKATIGSSGAVTLSAANSKGITSMTLGTAGLYTIVLADTYPALLNFHVSTLLASGTPVNVSYAIQSQAVSTAGTQNIVIQFMGQDGAAVNPDSGAVLYFTITLNNSSAI